MKTIPPLLEALRTATRPAHDRLEALTLGDRILDGSLQAAEYERLIDWQRRVHRVLEPRVKGFRGGAGYAYRARVVDASEEPCGTPPMSDYDDLPSTLGILYVLEGASLGGSVIHKKLLANPALAAYAPFDFYREQAEWGLQQWRAYLNYVKDLELDPGQVERAVASAVATFALFERLW